MQEKPSCLMSDWTVVAKLWHHVQHFSEIGISFEIQYFQSVLHLFHCVDLDNFAVDFDNFFCFLRGERFLSALISLIVLFGFVELVVMVVELESECAFSAKFGDGNENDDEVGIGNIDNVGDLKHEDDDDAGVA